MSTIDDLINDYAIRAQSIYDNETAGDHTWSGLLAEFTRHLPAFNPDRLSAAAADGVARFDDVYRRRTAGAYTFVGLLARFANSIDAREVVVR